MDGHGEQAGIKMHGNMAGDGYKDKDADGQWLMTKHSP